MCQHHERTRRAERPEPLRRTSMERELRRPMAPHDLDPRPVDPSRMPRTERLHRRLLGGKARRVRRREITLRTAVRNFTVGKDAAQEAIAVTFDRFRNAVDFGGVEPDTYNLHSVLGSYMTVPVVPPSFYWTTETWGAALRCRPLEPFAQHLFTTRQLRLPSAEAWHALASAIAVSADRVVSLNQVHGRDVVRIDRNITTEALQNMRQQHPKGDALISDAPDVALVVRAADCVPLLIADPRTGAAAAVHAGWRGTAARVAVAAVERMQRDFGSRAADLIVAIGPAIGPCCYEVGSDVVDAFAAAGHERYLIDRWFLTPRERKLRLDVVGANRDLLILAGVQEENIHACGLCTAMHLDLLTSYRAEANAAGRIGAAIRASVPIHGQPKFTPGASQSPHQ